MRVVLPWLIVVGLTIYSLVDCAQTEDDEVRSLPKLVWVLLILVFPVVGPISWVVAGRPQRPRRTPRRGAGGTSGPAHPRQPPPGPDYDPDFLRRLLAAARTSRPTRARTAPPMATLSQWVAGARP